MNSSDTDSDLHNLSHFAESTDEDELKTDIREDQSS